MADQGVSIVVPTLNRGDYLIQTVKDLLSQEHRPLEIVIVDQSGEVDPELASLAAEHPDLVVHHRVEFRGLPRARNYGWKRARHDAVVFIDDDVRCGPDLASEHLRALRLTGVGLVAGGIEESRRVEPTCRRPGRYRRWTAAPLRGFSAHGEEDVDHAGGGNFSAWRTAIEAAGGFDEALGRGAALFEETDFCLRVQAAGFRVYFNGRARLTHLAAPGGGCRVDGVVDYVRSMAHNRGVMIRRHGRWFHVPTALGRLALLGLSYARHYRSPRSVAACVAGGLSGLRAGGHPPYAADDGRGGPS